MRDPPRMFVARFDKSERNFYVRLFVVVRHLRKYIISTLRVAKLVCGPVLFRGRLKIL